jgi:hypothetical protein
MLPELPTQHDRAKHVICSSGALRLPVSSIRRRRRARTLKYVAVGAIDVLLIVAILDAGLTREIIGWVTLTVSLPAIVAQR